MTRFLFIYRLLIILLILLCVVLVGGTLYAFFLPSPTPPSQPMWRDLSSERVFNGIGLIRTSTKPPSSATVILSVSFPYDPRDTAFAEELALRIRDFRDITAEYITSFSTEELEQKKEAEIKEEVLRRYNAILRLGQLRALYFSDFMLLD